MLMKNVELKASEMNKRKKHAVLVFITASILLILFYWDGRKDGFVAHNYAYAVSVKISVYVPLALRGGVDEDLESIIMQDLVADVCYLDYYSKEKNDDYAEEVLKLLIYGFLENHLNKYDFFSPNQKMILVSPKNPNKEWSVEPFKILEAVKLTSEEYDSCREWYSRNWK